MEGVGRLSSRTNADIKKALEGTDLAEDARYRREVRQHNLPWNVTPDATNEKCFVKFNTNPFGITFIKQLLELAVSPKAPERFTFTPVYQKSFVITRDLRASLNQAVSQFDEKIRMFFIGLQDQKSREMQSFESMWYGTRVFEEWSEEETGLIGIQGWSQIYVNRFFEELNELFAPKRFSTTNYQHLLSGAGEMYARSLNQIYDGKVIIEIDKFNDCILIIGDASDSAIEDLESYDARKDSFKIRTRIPLRFPFFNDQLSTILNSDYLVRIRNCLEMKHLSIDSKINDIKFHGTVQSYELFIAALKNIDIAIFEEQTMGIEEIPHLNCQACMGQVEKDGDFCRLNCGHIVCRDCVNIMIRSNLNDASYSLLYKCYDSGCTNFLSPSDVMNVILGGANRIRDFDAIKISTLVSRAKQGVVIRNNNLATCPAVDCSGIRMINKSVASGNCNVCSREYCAKCLEDLHEGYTCEERKRLQQPDNSLAEYIRISGPHRVKPCPNCRVFVEKNEGCNHMQCRCGAHFCWICLHQTEDELDCNIHLQAAHNRIGDIIIAELDFDEFDILPPVNPRQQLRGIFGRRRDT